jgi:hypothetical protein
MTVISGTGLVVSIEYPADGLAWARLYDNAVHGWLIDDVTGLIKQPSIIGSLPTAAPDTSPILSPQWVEYIAPTIFVPDLWRGSFAEWLTWLATNNGAKRPLEGRFRIATDLYNGWQAWAQANPSLVHAG